MKALDIRKCKHYTTCLQIKLTATVNNGDIAFLSNGNSQSLDRIKRAIFLFINPYKVFILGTAKKLILDIPRHVLGQTLKKNRSHDKYL